MTSARQTTQEMLERCGQMLLDRTFRNIEFGCCLLITQTGHTVEHENPPGEWWQVLQMRGKLPYSLPGRRDLIGPSLIISNVGDFLVRDGGRAAALRRTDMVHGQVVGGTEKKSAAGSCWQCIAVLDKPQKCFLHEISREITVAQPLTDIVGEFAPMTRKQPADPPLAHDRDYLRNIAPRLCLAQMIIVRNITCFFCY